MYYHTPPNNSNNKLFLNKRLENMLKEVILGPGMVHTFNPNIKKAEVGGPQPGLQKRTRSARADTL